MTRTLLAVMLVVGIVAAFTLPHALAQSGDRTDRMRQRWENMPEEKRERAMAMAEKGRMFSKCTYLGNGTVQSRFVQFHYVKETGQIHDLTVRTDRNETTRFFSEIEPTPFSATKNPDVMGAVFRHQADNLTIRGHCNPTAVFGWWNHNGTHAITFTLAGNATASAVNGTTNEVRVSVGSTHGHILASGNGTIVLVGQDVTVTLGPNDKAMFRAHPNMGQAKTLHEQNRAFRMAKLGAVVNLVNVDGDAVTDSEDVDVETEAQEVSHGHVKLVARGNVHGNRVIFLTVDSETLDVHAIARIHVTVGGAAAANATNASAVQDAMGAAVFVTETDGSVQLIINVPHFSDQTIEVQQAGSTGGAGASGGETKTGTPGFGLVGLLVALVVVAAVRRR